MKPHLCQPGPGRSCAACCGLYNFRDRSRETTIARLREHTEAVHALGYEDQEALRNWSQKQQAREQPDLLVPSLPTCPFVGLLPGERVGCLLHPKVTGGLDLRALGVYQDREICEAFLCPSFTWLKENEFSAILAASPDWYSYGLAVTDVELLREVLKHVQAHLGTSVRPEQLGRDEARRHLRRFFLWKETWPYRAPQKRFGSFSVEGGGEPRRAWIDYASLGVRPSPFDKILLCLESCFESKEQLFCAEREIEQAIKDLAHALCAKDP